MDHVVAKNMAERQNRQTDGIIQSDDISSLPHSCVMCHMCCGSNSGIADEGRLRVVKGKCPNRLRKKPHNFRESHFWFLVV